MENFCLKWNDFQPNVKQSFQKLRHEEEITDVTLIGDDYHPILAHKVVLTSCSEYFKNVFYKSKTKHSIPVLCMVGLSHDDLKKVLDYMYNGELQIYQEDLDRFLTIAERLKLEGLINPGEPESTSGKTEDKSCVNAVNSKDVYDLMSSIHKPEYEDEKTVIIQSEDLSNQELNGKLNELFTENIPGQYACNFCPKIVKGFKNKSHMRDHVELHVDGLKFSCNFCDKFYRYTLAERILHTKTSKIQN